VSWYGVARLRALSGFAGTMMSQFTFATAATAADVALADGLPEGAPLGQGDAGAEAEGPAAAAALPDAAGLAADEPQAPSAD